MHWMTIFSGLLMALGMIMPLAWKWEIKFGHALTGAFVFGPLSGLIVGGGELHEAIGWPLTFGVEMLLILLMSGTAAAFLFSRNPEREAPDRPGIVVAPADGRVVYVKKTDGRSPVFSQKRGRVIEMNDVIPDGSFPGSFHQIGIGMNLLNVHVNRAPIGGDVSHAEHLEGLFLSLKKPEALIKNERALTVIDNGTMHVGVIQIASRLVRRIVSYVGVGQSLAIGQRIGMIKFGSQVDVLIPAKNNVAVRVRPGDETVAGVTVIADYET